MLVRFESDVGNLTMFGDVAVRLLRMMGLSGTVPGALLPDDVPGALERLKRALDAQPDAATGAAPDAAKGETEPPVPLRRRAFPLVELLGRAATRECEVMWK
jgi:hypothetical protein